MPISYSGDNVTFPDGSTLASGRMGMVNRIINGDMRIDQRNSGASVTPSVLFNTYTLDRWNAVYSVASKFSVQQNAGAVTPPVGFTKYLGVTSLSAYSVGAEQFNIQQIIEGFNIADLAWGTANAKTVTLSFWTYSSLTGNFGGVVQNGSNTRSYPFLYSIPVANTWTQISITIAGDTTGTWTTDNTAGLSLRFSLGAGSTLSGTAGAWAGTGYYSATGATSVVGTNGATFYITGVDLRIGTYATAPTWEFRSYQQELALCQRYYEVCQSIGTAGYSAASQGIGCSTTFSVTKRAAPSITTTQAPSYTNASGFVITLPSVNGFAHYSMVTATGGANYGYTTSAIVTASAEL